MVFHSQSQSLGKWLFWGVFLLLLAFFMRVSRQDTESASLYLELLLLVAGSGSLFWFFYLLLSENPVSLRYREKERQRRDHPYLVSIRLEIQGMPILFFNPYRFGRWTEARVFAVVTGTLLIVALSSDTERLRMALQLMFSALPGVTGLLASLYRQGDEETLADDWHLTGFVLSVVSLILNFILGHSGLPLPI